MSVIGHLHDSLVFPRRVRVLAARIATQLPPGAGVLDFGCGDGQVAAAVMASRPDVSIRGADVLARPLTHIPVDLYDGAMLPFDDASFDVVMIVDVLHHTEDPGRHLLEARRVCRGVLLVKDHLCDPWLGRARLRLMDCVGNGRHGVALTHHYWSRAQWSSAFHGMGLRQESWDECLGLYPGGVAWLFETSLHFLARLRVPR